MFAERLITMVDHLAGIFQGHGLSVAVTGSVRRSLNTSCRTLPVVLGHQFVDDALKPSLGPAQSRPPAFRLKE
jgi:hypothetical protein